MYIACPKCGWRPEPGDLWVCTCGHHWHTFDTHGVCPACGLVWKETRCYVFGGCGQWSDHEDWYHQDDSRSVEEFLADEWRARIGAPAQDTPSPGVPGTPGMPGAPESGAE